MSGTVLTIGKFDGVHAGHSYLLSRVVEEAARRGLEPAAMTFDRHPACVVAPERAPQPLMPLEERCARIRELGIRQVYVLKFTPEIAKLSPEEFVAQYVHREMDARLVMVGENFRFGHKQSGDPKVLEELGRSYGFETQLVPAIKTRGIVVSTSEVRQRLAQGQVSLAGRLLGRPYALEGAIVHGEGIGSRQTVPTLNLETPAEVLPADGVYITRTRERGGTRQWNSITNIGMRPTFEGTSRTVETYLLSAFDGAAPERIRLEFLRRVREERKFDSPEALKAQIMRDVQVATSYFRRVALRVRPELP
jgi:riboflavin kinase/FMN adenylyltransferase